MTYLITHQEGLCAKSAGFADVMKFFAKAVNFILSHAFNHRQFQDSLAEINSKYNDLLHFY